MAQYDYKYDFAFMQGMCCIAGENALNTEDGAFQICIIQIGVRFHLRRQAFTLHLNGYAPQRRIFSYPYPGNIVPMFLH